MDNSSEHEIEVNGKKYTFKVQKDLTEPCPQCGIPACGKENYFWFEEKELRHTLILDGAILDSIINQYFKANIQKIKYASLPKFLRESNECIGWSEADDFEGTKIDIDDLLSAIDLIQTDELEDQMQEYLNELKEIGHKAIQKKTELYLARS